jgi:hypothetical protein
MRSPHINSWGPGAYAYMCENRPRLNCPISVAMRYRCGERDEVRGSRTHHKLARWLQHAVEFACEVKLLWTLAPG